MIAFAPSAALAPVKPAIGSTSFAQPLSSRPVRASNAPTMLLRIYIRGPASTATSTFGGAGAILDKADKYMGSCIRTQYINMTNPGGTYSVQCTEGSVSGAAEVSRVRALNSKFRASQASPFKVAFDKYENRKNAIVASHGCHHEEGQFCDFDGVAANYNVSKSEALGQCFRYALPESIEEAAMVRYMDIQQNNAANPTGVYNIWCNEGAARGQAEDIRVAALNTAYRQGQKSMIKLMDEKYQQKRAGYAAAHDCDYEEGIVSKFPAVGAAFRPRTYGY